MTSSLVMMTSSRPYPLCVLSVVSMMSSFSTIRVVKSSKSDIALLRWYSSGRQLPKKKKKGEDVNTFLHANLIISPFLFPFPFFSFSLPRFLSLPRSLSLSLTLWCGFIVVDLFEQRIHILLLVDPSLPRLKRCVRMTSPWIITKKLPCATFSFISRWWRHNLSWLRHHLSFGIRFLLGSIGAQILEEELLDECGIEC